MQKLKESLEAQRAESSKKARKKALLEVGKTLDPFGFESYRDYLRAVHEKLNAEGKSFSFLQMAEDMGLGKTNATWQYVTGRRRISEKSLRKVCDALALGPTERAYVLMLREYAYADQPREREKIYETLIRLKGDSPNIDTRMMRFYNEWYHPVIRELAGLDNFKSDPDWIASRIYVRLRPKQIQDSLNLLTELGLLRYDSLENRHFRTEEDILPDQYGSPLAMTQFHQRMSELAAKSLTEVAAERREMNSLTISISEDIAQEIAKMLYDSCAKIMDLEKKSKSKEHVFQVNMQLFPITKPQGENKR